ncbi:MAG: hypothetical protein JWR10_802 [Rubritepida sp.]|nr:hypothetical protein [Rubritepida sp.]
MRLGKLFERPMDEVRRRLLEAARDRRIGLKELSTRVGKNPSYFQQYIAKGSPRVLPDDVHAELEKILWAPAGELSDGASGPSIEVAEPRPGLLSLSTSHSRTLLSQISERNPVDLASLLKKRRAAEGLSAPRPVASVALTLTRQHGLLQPRHVLICDVEPAIRVGDLVVVIQEQRVAGIGQLVSVGQTTTISEGAAVQELTGSYDALWRVLSVLTDR